MSLGIGFDESTRAAKGMGVSLSSLLDNSTATTVIPINNMDSTGFIKGIKLQDEKLEILQKGLCHHVIGISCTARINANGK